MKLQVLGIDLGKTIFHLVGLDSVGRMCFASDVLGHSCWPSPRICRGSSNQELAPDVVYTSEFKVEAAAIPTG